MKSVWRRLSWLAIAGALVALGVWAAVEDAAAQEANVASAPAEAVGRAQEPIDMVELTLQRDKMRGRLLFENDESLNLEPMGGGAIGYRKENVVGIRRFKVPAIDYYVEVGTFCRQQAWQVKDAPAMFIKARQAYQKAQALADSEQSRATADALLEAVTAERQQWQREMLQKEQLEKARYETELARLKRDLTQGELTTVANHTEAILELQTSVRELRRDLHHLTRRIVSNKSFLDLKRSHERLERDVDRLEDRLREPRPDDDRPDHRPGH